jgi:phosphohistidine phosphatase
MRRLILLRHAKTEHVSPSGRDLDRRLDQRGRRDAAEMGGWLGRHPPFPDTVLVSKAARTHETWQIAWEVMKNFAPEPIVEILPELYGADSSQLLDTIRMASPADPQRLMLIGHNPGMHELALALAHKGDPAGRTALAENLPTSGLAIFDFAVEDWADVTYCRGRLVLFVSPKLLKQTSDD